MAILMGLLSNSQYQAYDILADLSHRSLAFKGYIRLALVLSNFQVWILLFKFSQIDLNYAFAAKIFEVQRSFLNMEGNLLVQGFYLKHRK